jgi:hypothetical protein
MVRLLDMGSPGFREGSDWKSSSDRTGARMPADVVSLRHVSVRNPTRYSRGRLRATESDVRDQPSKRFGPTTSTCHRAEGLRGVVSVNNVPVPSRKRTTI